MFGLAFIWGIIFYKTFIFKHNNITTNASYNSPTTTDSDSSHSLLPIISNQWYSSLQNDFPSSPLYAMPLVFKTTTNGLGFSYPTIKKSNNTIAASYTEDFAIGYKTPFVKTQITNVGDWTITAELITSDIKKLSFLIGHGLPYAIIKPIDETEITTTDTARIMINNKEVNGTSFTTDAFLLVTNTNNYIITLPKNTKIQRTNKKISIEKVDRIFIGLLDKKENYNLFKTNSQVEILDSQASFHINENLLTIIYKLSSEHGTPLLTLYPHQSNLYPAKKEILGTYQTIRGPLQLIKTDSFSLSIPLSIPNGSFTKLEHEYPDLKEQIKTDIDKMIADKAPGSKDYFLGTWFGKVSTLLLLADAYELEEEKQKLLQFVEPIFLESLNYFSYDKSKTSLIATKPEFGNEQLNDHHFHYGYYIRTAAVISNFDFPFLTKVKNKIDMMVSDIATLERSSTEYPYLRTFDIYEGHSWADGLGDTNDGNNQESSSEAINAWYAVYLWGKINNDNNLQKNALALYNLEIQSASYYWFDKTNLYSTPYTHAIGSILWGGKIDFATWFSNDTNMIYGIQLLPITPASMYLGTLPSFIQYKQDFLASGGNATKDWGDLFTIWESFYNPTGALQLKNFVTKHEANTPRSLFLYMLYYNNENNPTFTPTVSPTL